jgi:hypothetical protein
MISGTSKRRSKVQRTCPTALHALLSTVIAGSGSCLSRSPGNLPEPGVRSLDDIPGHGPGRSRRNRSARYSSLCALAGQYDVDTHHSQGFGRTRCGRGGSVLCVTLAVLHPRDSFRRKPPRLRVARCGGTCRWGLEKDRMRFAIDPSVLVILGALGGELFHRSGSAGSSRSQREEVTIN